MKPWVLITGASSGIGKQFALEYAKLGYNCCLTARRADLLETVAQTCESFGVSTYVLPLDLLEEDSAIRLSEWVKALGIQLDILINNAGFGDYGPFIDASLPKLKDMITLNDTRLVEVSYACLPLMKQPSKIIQVASLASFMPGPNMAVYYASKAFVLSFAQALNQELKPKHISVLALCPGPVATEFGEVANAKGIAAFNVLRSQSVEQAIDNAIKDIAKDKPILFTNPIHPFIVFLLRLVPRQTVVKIVEKIQKKRHEG